MNMLMTIGHSNHPIERFLDLLKQHGITALADVRSHPYSRFAPRFSKGALQAALEGEGITYVFLGKELGARSPNPACYRYGKVQYDLLAGDPAFVAGLDRLRAGLERYRIAMMCAEKDPLDCHRGILVGRRMNEAGCHVGHIHADGRLETNSEMEGRMLRLQKSPAADLFRSRPEILAEAYRMRGEKFAYRDKGMFQASKDTIPLGADGFYVNE